MEMNWIKIFFVKFALFKNEATFHNSKLVMIHAVITFVFVEVKILTPF